MQNPNYPKDIIDVQDYFNEKGELNVDFRYGVEVTMKSVFNNSTFFYASNFDKKVSDYFDCLSRSQEIVGNSELLSLAKSAYNNITQIGEHACIERDLEKAKRTAIKARDGLQKICNIHSFKPESDEKAKESSPLYAIEQINQMLSTLISKADKRKEQIKELQDKAKELQEHFKLLAKTADNHELKDIYNTQAENVPKMNPFSVFLLSQVYCDPKIAPYWNRIDPKTSHKILSVSPNISFLDGYDDESEISTVPLTQSELSKCMKMLAGKIDSVFDEDSLSMASSTYNHVCTSFYMLKNWKHDSKSISEAIVECMQDLKSLPLFDKLAELINAPKPFDPKYIVNKLKTECPDFISPQCSSFVEKFKEYYIDKTKINMLHVHRSIQDPKNHEHYNLTPRQINEVENRCNQFILSLTHLLRSESELDKRCKFGTGKKKCAFREHANYYEMRGNIVHESSLKSSSEILDVLIQNQRDAFGMKSENVINSNLFNPKKISVISRNAKALIDRSDYLSLYIVMGHDKMGFTNKEDLRYINGKPYRVYYPAYENSEANFYSVLRNIFPDNYNPDLYRFGEIYLRRSLDILVEPVTGNITLDIDIDLMQLFLSEYNKQYGANLEISKEMISEIRKYMHQFSQDIKLGTDGDMKKEMWIDCKPKISYLSNSSRVAKYINESTLAEISPESRISHIKERISYPDIPWPESDDKSNFAILLIPISLACGKNIEETYRETSKNLTRFERNIMLKYLTGCASLPNKEFKDFLINATVEATQYSSLCVEVNKIIVRAQNILSAIKSKDYDFMWDSKGRTDTEIAKISKATESIARNMKPLCLNVKLQRNIGVMDECLEKAAELTEKQNAETNRLSRKLEHYTELLQETRHNKANNKVDPQQLSEKSIVLEIEYLKSKIADSKRKEMGISFMIGEIKCNKDIISEIPQEHMIDKIFNLKESDVSKAKTQLRKYLAKELSSQMPQIPEPTQGFQATQAAEGNQAAQNVESRTQRELTRKRLNNRSSSLTRLKY